MNVDDNIFRCNYILSSLFDQQCWYWSVFRYFFSIFPQFSRNRSNSYESDHLSLKNLHHWKSFAFQGLNDSGSFFFICHRLLFFYFSLTNATLIFDDFLCTSVWKNFMQHFFLSVCILHCVDCNKKYKEKWWIRIAVELPQHKIMGKKLKDNLIKKYFTPSIVYTYFNCTWNQITPFTRVECTLSLVDATVTVVIVVFLLILKFFFYFFRMYMKKKTGAGRFDQTRLDEIKFIKIPGFYKLKYYFFKL